MIKNFIEVQLIERFRLSLIKISRLLGKHNATPVDFKKKKFLFNTQYIWGFSEIEFMCAAQLKLLGHQVIVIICDGLPYSEREIVDLPKVKSYKACLNRTKRYCNAYGIEYITINSFLNDDDKNKAKELASKGIDSIKNFSKNNINLGDYAKRNHAHYFKGDIRPHGQFEKIYKSAFESAYLIESSFSKILLKYSGYDMISANGKFIQTGIPIELHKNLGGSFYTYEHFRQGNGVLVDKNKCSLEQNIDAVWNELKLINLTEDEKARLYHSFDLQQQSISLKEDLWDENRIDDESEIISLLELDPTKKIIACFPNVYWDSVHMGINAVSKDLTSWLEDMIKFANLNQEIQLIIRTHPGELKIANILQSKFTISDSLKDRFKKIPKNVKIIDPKSNISSYSLARIADANLLWNGTMGLEIALRGIKPVVIADAYYANKGFTIDFLNFTELENYLLNLDSKQLINKEERRLLEIFSFHIRFNRKFNAPYYKGRWCFTYNYLQIKPGKNKTLDRLVGFFLDKNSYMSIGSFDFE